MLPFNRPLPLLLLFSIFLLCTMITTTDAKKERSFRTNCRAALRHQQMPDHASQEIAQEFLRQALKQRPTDATANALLGISLANTNRLSDAVPFLTRATQADVSDWVTHEYLAAAYAFLAKRLATNMRVLQNAGKTSDYNNALGEVIRCYKIALRHRPLSNTGASTSSLDRFDKPPPPSRASAPSLEAYPQSYFARPLTYLYRGLGDALAWLGDSDGAHVVFQHAVDQAKLWRDPLVRPAIVFDVVGPVQPFFDGSNCQTNRLCAADFDYIIKPLKSSVAAIAAELERVDYNSIQSGPWNLERAGLHHSQSWSTIMLLVNGQHKQACKAFPTTCKTLSLIPEVFIKDGQAKFSAMGPGTVVKPHAGPTNGRLRLQCALVVPVPADSAAIRVGVERRSWSQGECFVFDESTEHEVHMNGTTPRVVIIVDFANPLVSSLRAYQSILTDDEWKLRSNHHTSRWKAIHQRVDQLRVDNTHGSEL